MTQATSAPSRVGYISATLTQLVTPGEGGRLESMHHALKTGDQKIGVLQQNLNGICNVVGTIDQK